MFKLLQGIFNKIVCHHDWQEKQAIEHIRRDSILIDAPARITGFTYLYVCKKCGKFKKIDL